MPHWAIKAAMQKALSLMPGSLRLSTFLQDHLTRSTKTLTRHSFERKLEQGCRQIQEYYDAVASEEPPAYVLELGTGWYPIVPAIFRLCGARRIWTADRVDMLRTHRLQQMLKMFLDYDREGTLVQKVPRLEPGRLSEVRAAFDACASGESPGRLMSQLSIECLPGDARKLPLPDDSIDCVFSNLVIGFIPKEVLSGLMREFARVISPTGAMCHFIDMSDLYALFDRRITGYNFLRFSERTWRLINNDIQYLNRLRITDYRDLHAENGFRIVRTDLLPGSPEELAKVPLADEFRRYTPEDLAVKGGWIISRPQKG